MRPLLGAASGKRPGDMFSINSVNYYVRRGLVNNVHVKTAVATMVAYVTLRYFNSPSEIEDFIMSCTQHAPSGRLVPNIGSFQSQIGIHRGGLFKSILGSFSTDPVYNPSKYGPKLGTLKLKDCITCLNYGIEPTFSEFELAETVVKDLTITNKLIFANAQNFQTEGNLNSLELEIVTLVNLRPLFGAARRALAYRLRRRK